MPFVHQLRVRYHECDAQGHVFNAHYVAYFDVAITELWREAFGSYAAMLELGVDMVVAEVRARWRGSARFDELIDIELAFARLGTTSITSRVRVLREGEELLEGELRHVFVVPGSGAVTAMPDEVRAALERYAA